MLRVAVVLVTVLSLPACLSSSRTPARVTGGILAGTGTILTLGGATADCTRGNFGDALGCGIQAGMVGTAGLVLLAIGGSMLIYNEVRTPPAATVEPSPAAVVTERRYVANAAEIGEPATDDPMLRQLTLQASVAARAGHCGVVRAVADRVDDLDRAYRRSGFVSDHAISACMR